MTEPPAAAPATNAKGTVVLIDVEAEDALAHHDARVSAARALITVRERTGKPIPDDVRDLAKG